MAEQDNSRNSIQVIERMASLLDALAAHNEPTSLKQLAQATGLHPSTAHRILAAMVTERLADRLDGGTYQLGMRLLELGNIVKNRINIREIALPHMRGLHARIGEAVNLGIRHGDHIVYVERTSSGRSAIRVVYLVGERGPLHTTSVGKLFLAEDSTDDVRDYAGRTGLPGHTQHSLTTLAALEKELEKVRRHSIAFDNEEIEIGLKCVAAGIRNDEGELVAGLSVSAPAERADPDWAQTVRACADDISRALGYRVPKRA